MNYKIFVNEVKSNESKAKAYATVVFGDSLVVRNIAVVEKKDGQGVFVSMPSRKTRETDEYGNTVYKDICNPITSHFQKEFSGAIAKAYELKRDGILPKEGLSVGAGSGAPSFKVRVTPYEKEGSKIRGIASIYLDDSFVISNVCIINGKNGEFVSMPAYRDKSRNENGDNSYREIVFPITKEFREQLYGEILNTYHERKTDKEKMAANPIKHEENAAKQKETQLKEDTPFR